MANLDRVIDTIMQAAMARGEFDNLRGKGQPLNLKVNPHVERDWQLAFSMLEQHGFALPWIEDRKEIEQSLAAAQTALRRSWEWCQNRLADNDGDQLAEEEWRKAVRRFSESAAALNVRIKAYNLAIPADVFCRPVIDVGREIKEISTATPE
jgi:DnaJ family protein C protein 28